MEKVEADIKKNSIKTLRFLSMPAPSKKQPLLINYLTLTNLVMGGVGVFCRSDFVLSKHCVFTWVLGMDSLSEPVWPSLSVWVQHVYLTLIKSQNILF